MMRHIRLIPIVSILVIAGCSSPFTDAEDAVRAHVKDANSTEFRDVAFCGDKTGNVIRGEFNSKNSYGAYAGYEKFYYDGGVVELPDDYGYLALMDRCSAQIRARTKEIQAETAAIRGQITKP